MKKKPAGPHQYRQLEGFKTRRTPRGAIVVELDLEADPAKRDPAWQAQMRAVFPSENDWRREFKRDWTSASGAAYYPEFAAQPHRYIRACTSLLAGPVYRGWDFGFWRPACVWFQFSRATNRAWVLREVMPDMSSTRGIDTHSFRDLVLYLSGQITLDSLAARPLAMAWVKKIQDDPKLPNPPWFTADPSSPIQWEDYAGPEALRPSASVEGEASARTDKAILEAAGIRLNVFASAPSARGAVMRRLLHFYSDGWPGILFDPACPIMIETMNGGLAFAKPKPGELTSDDPAKNGYHDNIHDALGYGIVNVASAVQPSDRIVAPPVTRYVDRRPVVEDPSDAEQIPWAEVVKPGW